MTSLHFIVEVLISMWTQHEALLGLVEVPEKRESSVEFHCVRTLFRLHVFLKVLIPMELQLYSRLVQTNSLNFPSIEQLQYSLFI